MSSYVGFKLTTHHYVVPVQFHLSKHDNDWNPPGEETEGITGYIDKNGLVIHVLTDGVAPAIVADTVLHEALHLCHMAGGGETEKETTEEQVVNIFTAGLKQLLVNDNDEFFEYLGVNL